MVGVEVEFINKKINPDKTTCPLDCYDGCEIEFDGQDLKGSKTHPVTRGYLCYKMDKFLKYQRIKTPRYKGEEVSLEEALDILSAKLKEFKDGNNLFLKGSGNLGKLQSITKEFFARFGFVGTKGSLCDGSGDAGIKEGRGANLLVPLYEVKNSEVVVIWGRNPEVTNTHLSPLLKDKKIIVIDPYRTNLSKKADLFLQIKPRGDLFLVFLLARIIYMQQLEDEDFIENRCEGFEDFIELIEEYHLKQLSKLCGIDIDKAWEMVDLISDKKTLFLVGIGVQKYITGHYVLRAIDSLATMLGLFGKSGSGVSFLSDSSYGFKKLFKDFQKRVTLPNIDFSKFDMVFIQGANPLVSMPSTKKVKEGWDKAKFRVYFGLYENESAKEADLILPVVDFLSKEDVRASYGHEFIGFMPKLRDSKSGISEYELTNFLLKKFFDDKLKDEKEYIKEFVSSNSIEKDGLLISKNYRDTPYKNGFFTESKKFIFLDEYDDDFLEDYEDDEGYYLLTRKDKKSLNSSFFSDEYLYIPPILGFSDDEEVRVISDYGEAIFKIKIDKNLRNDTLLTKTGNPKQNYLTPNFCSIEGDNASFQELKVRIEKVL